MDWWLEGVGEVMGRKGGGGGGKGEERGGRVRGRKGGGGKGEEINKM